MTEDWERYVLAWLDDIAGRLGKSPAWLRDEVLDITALIGEDLPGKPSAERARLLLGIPDDGILRLVLARLKAEPQLTTTDLRFALDILGCGPDVERHSWLKSRGLPDMRSMLALLAAAEATRTLHLGTLVLDINYRQLALLAKEVATLDLLSEGRLELGLGAGWIARESQMAGMPFDPADQRVGRLEEAVHLLKGLFSRGPLTFSGHFYTLNGFEVFPKPLQRPHPPLLLSGGGKRMLSIAAREADIITLNPPVAPDGNSIDMADATAEGTAQQIAWIREAAGDRFDQIEIGNFVLGGVRIDKDQPLDPLIARAFRSRTTGEQQAPQGIYTLVGSVEQICEQVLANREHFGISYIGILEQDLDTFAPVVAQLAGK